MSCAPPATDPIIGKWKLNLAKSTFSPGPPPRSQTATYTKSAQGMHVTLQTTAANGKVTTATIAYVPDGRPYTVNGDPDYDIMAATQVDPLTVQIVFMTAAKTVGTAVRTVSQDGKTMTYAQKGTRANGVKYDYLMVFDRQ
jgi:hypothetical protein